MTATAAPRTERADALSVYRDDGPVARAIGRALGSAVRLPALALVAAGLAPLLVLAITGAPHGVAAAVVAWLVLCGGAAGGRPPRGRVRWALPPAVRAGEYAGLVWLASLAGPDSLPAAFALLAAVAFRSYDLVYRLRHRGVTPAPWVNALSLGWDGRLLLGAALLLAGALPAGFYVAAAVFAAAFVGEAVVGWVAVGRVARPLEYEDEEDEGQ